MSIDYDRSLLLNHFTHTLTTILSTLNPHSPYTKIKKHGQTHLAQLHSPPCFSEFNMISFQLCSNLFNINSKIQYKKHSKKIILALVFYYKLLIYQKSKATSNCMLPESSVKQKPGIILNTFSCHYFLIRRLTFLFHLLGLSKKAQECCLCIFFFNGEGGIMLSDHKVVSLNSVNISVT